MASAPDPVRRLRPRVAAIIATVSIALLATGLVNAVTTGVDTAVRPHRSRTRSPL